VAAHDQGAFTVLIERHGPMVLGVCRRALPNFHDAEDACQATFLVLARKSASVRKKTSLSSWLHGVACRVGASLKRDHARRRSRERQADAPAPMDPAAEVSWREAQTILDDELRQLPDRYRVPLILCYLECLTRDEAAQQLGISSGSLHGQLQRARELLRQRLTKRGLTLSAVMSAAALGESAAHAALAPRFVVSSTRAALLLAAGQPVTEGVVATNVLTLTREVLKSMFLTKLKLGTAAVLCVGLFATLIGGSFTSLGVAQEAKPPLGPAAPAVDPGSPTGESDADFIRRISKDLRGIDPTPAEIHFFATSKDAGRRQKLIDLFIQERQAKKDAAAKNALDHPMHQTLLYGMPLQYNWLGARLDHPTHGQLLYGMPPTQYNWLGAQLDHATYAQALLHGMPQTWHQYALVQRLVQSPTGQTPQGEGLGALQREFYKDLHGAKEKGDVAKITQSYLDRLVDLVKTNPKSQDAPDAMRQIVFLYESRGKTVEAEAWRNKLLKEYPKTSLGADRGGDK
jgi:RNA polymerase sigma factor (sigma-70 family)